MTMKETDSQSRLERLPIHGALRHTPLPFNHMKIQEHFSHFTELN